MTMPETTAQREDRIRQAGEEIRVSVNGASADDSPIADAIQEAVNARDELPGMPPPVRPRFEGVEMHTLEVSFTGTVKLDCTPASIRLFKQFRLGKTVYLPIEGVVVDRPIGGLKLDGAGDVDWSKTRSRATIRIHSFDTPDAG